MTSTAAATGELDQLDQLGAKAFDGFSDSYMAEVRSTSACSRMASTPRCPWNTTR